MRETPWCDGDVGVEIRADELNRRRVTADEASTTSKMKLTNGRANVDGIQAGEVELQPGGVALRGGIGIGEVNSKAAVVNDTGAGGFSMVDALNTQEELRAKAMVEAARTSTRDPLEVEREAERERARIAEETWQRAEKQKKLNRRASRAARRLEKLQDRESREQLNGEMLRPPVERMEEPDRSEKDVVVAGGGGMLAQQDAHDDVHATVVSEP